MALFIISTYMFICLVLFMRGGFRGGIFHPLQKILGHFLTYVLIPLLSVIFALALGTNLYVMIGSTHHTPNPVIYIPWVSPTLVDIVATMWLCKMQISCLASFFAL